MKSIFAAFIYLTLSYGLRAQCSMKVDEFTKDTIVSTKKVQIATAERKGLSTPLFMSAQVERVAGEYLIYLYPEFEIRTSFKAGDMVYFLMDDESVVKIPVAQNDRSYRASGIPFVQGYAAKIYQCVIQLIPAQEQLDVIVSKKIKKIRCELDFKLGSGKQQMIQNQIKCIAKY